MYDSCNTEDYLGRMKHFPNEPTNVSQPQNGYLAGVISWLLLFILLALMTFFGCKTPKSVEQHEHHYYESDTAGIQSIVNDRLSVWQQQMDSSWRQSLFLLSMEHWQNSNETEVTTETVTTATDSLGRVLKTEQRRTERTLSIQQQQYEQRITQELESRLRVALDSLDASWQQRYDAMLRHTEQNDSTSMCQKPAEVRPWYRRLFDRFHYIINGFLLAAVVWFTRRWWLRLFK